MHSSVNIICVFAFISMYLFHVINDNTESYIAELVGYMTTRSFTYLL